MARFTWKSSPVVNRYEDNPILTTQDVPFPSHMVYNAGVVQFGGKWRWGAPPLADVRGGLCPACERVRDHYPAGTLTIPASLVGDREELLGLIGNIERRESAEHPLERVIRIEESAESTSVTTTGIHLARCLASKLSRRFGRKAKLRYPEEQHLLFAEWEA